MITLAENPIQYFEDFFLRHHDTTCVVSGTASWTYGDLLREIGEDRRNLQSFGIGAGDVVIVAGNSQLRHLSLFFSLTALGATIVPLLGREDEIRQCEDVANATHVLSISNNENWTIERTSRSVTNPLLKRQFERGEAGLVMFTSGSTGKKKAILYSVPKVLRRFQARRKTYRSLMFSSIDHFGGWNTIFYILSNGGLIVFPSTQRPDEACRLIQEHRIELLPTTPSFINLLLLSGVADTYDLSSLKIITYGSEMMPETTLQNLRRRFPNVTLRQTYGLSELGQVKLIPRDPGSLAVKIVGEGFEAKVIDGILWVRSNYAMEGYLNGNAEFTEDGWFDTGDMVKMDGEFITFLGRKSELINVAGLKVYPAEVESFLLSQPGVSEALVSGEPNAFVGNTVVAQVVAGTDEPERAFIQRLKAECKKKLPRYMVPTRIHVVKQLHYSRQHKKIGISAAPPNNASISGNKEKLVRTTLHSESVPMHKTAPGKLEHEKASPGWFASIVHDQTNQLASKIDAASARFEENVRSMEELVSAVRTEEEQIRRLRPENVESQHRKGRLTARERMDLLIDPKSCFFELGIYAAFEMYEEWGGAPCAGVITGLARIHGRLFMLIVNDATVKAGAFFPMTVKKVIRAQNIAMENHIPTIYLVDSAGAFLPLQEDVFPDTDDFGRIFRNNAVMSAMGIPQITAIMGMCVGGGSYLPVMCDTILMTENSGLFLAGPALVQAAIGPKYSAEELGGAATHAQISGTVDYREPTDHLCLARIRSLVARMGERPKACFDRQKSEEPAYPAEEIYGIFEADPSRPYDVKEIIARIVDGSHLDEYKAEYGKTVICGYARIGGYAVGIVANQAQHVQQVDRHSGLKRVEFGRVLYTESSEKAARFIMDCNQSLVPLIFLHDVNGFMVGRDAEWSGIIKAGAKMVNAVANSVVPKITVIIGGSCGAGHYAMCGRAYDPRLVFAWPTARYAVMSGASAAGTLVEIKIKQLEKDGEKLSEQKKRDLFNSVKATYEHQTDPRYGAARLWIDKIIDPMETRQALITALEVASLNPEVKEFKTGVLQT